MRKQFTPQTIILRAKRRVDPDTLMAAFDSKGNALWDMPAPIRYAEHTKWRKHKRTGKRIPEPIQVPVYRGAPASYLRYVRSQVRRNQRKIAAAAAEVKALNEAEAMKSQEAEAALQDLVLNPGGHDVSEDFAT